MCLNMCKSRHKLVGNQIYMAKWTLIYKNKKFRVGETNQPFYTEKSFYIFFGIPVVVVIIIINIIIFNPHR